MVRSTTNRLLDALPSSLSRSLFYDKLTQAMLYQHQVLFDVRGPINRVYFPLDAVVLLVVPLSNGQNVKAAMVGRDGVLGACVGFGAKHSATRAVVHIPGQCLWCEIGTLTSAVAEFPELRSIVVAHEQALLSHAQQSAACNAVHNLENRLARHLLRAADLHGRDEFPLTQEHLAEMLGARRTTVTVVARRFQDAGAIKYRRGQMKVCDTAQLEKAACECYLAIKSNYQALCPDISERWQMSAARSLHESAVEAPR
jgi:CRP-like cAMP-binding protein